MKCWMIDVCSSLTHKTFCAKFESNINCGKNKIFASPLHKNFNLHTKTAASRQLIKCHSQDYNHPEEDGHALRSSDWRAFRAKLVAAEQQGAKLTPTLKWPGSDPDHDEPPSCITLGQRWAHPIHEPERGCLLVATEKLDGVHIFERTVVLMLSTGRVGPSGVILNRPSLMSIKEMRTTELDTTGVFSNRPLFFGGPLEEEGLFLVTAPQGQVGSVDDMSRFGAFDEVMSGLYYGTKESVGCAAEMVKRNLVSAGDFKFFDGYCEWEREQLKEEISAGYWRVVACSPGAIGLSRLGAVGLWGDILGLMGEKQAW